MNLKTSRAPQFPQLKIVRQMQPVTDARREPQRMVNIFDQDVFENHVEIVVQIVMKDFR